MDYQFSLNRSELVIGFCKGIKGLSGEIYSEGDLSFHKIELKEFVFCKEFKEYMNKRKESINRLVHICIIDKNSSPIGKFLFSIFDDIRYHKTGFPESKTDIILRGSLKEVLAHKELEIWNMWRISQPLRKNEWSSLSEDERRAWLKVVTNYNINKSNCYETEEIIFHLDGTYVTDYPSFFCALGEAINGPGGYYGFDVCSLIDCVHGGFGATAPFTLIWKNHLVAEKCLDTNSWVRDIEYKRSLGDKLLDKPELEELGDRPLFQALVEIIKNVGVTIVFE
ncbi:barstar family protein [Paenibacillus fonticola]|uniref:barstar family protein n=1 Tax=Paenibacillus fonticola TaxID=379896 RepID=UPI0003A620E0|nr:barstar family protein [Paenibacillus fonticola]